MQKRISRRKFLQGSAAAIAAASATHTGIALAAPQWRTNGLPEPTSLFHLASLSKPMTSAESYAFEIGRNPNLNGITQVFEGIDCCCGDVRGTTLSYLIMTASALSPNC
jgi:hypothetical protein